VNSRATRCASALHREPLVLVADVQASQRNNRLAKRRVAQEPVLIKHLTAQSRSDWARQAEPEGLVPLRTTRIIPTVKND
jgi:hypothetical protein